MKTLPLGITYATWGSVGLILVTVAGIVLFHESLSATGLIGLTMIIVGTVLINAF
jgi:Membrane transporters of cations and cationic drugs